MTTLLWFTYGYGVAWGFIDGVYFFIIRNNHGSVSCFVLILNNLGEWLESFVVSGVRWVFWCLESTTEQSTYMTNRPDLTMRH